MTKKFRDIPEYGIHYRVLRRNNKKPRHAGPVKPVISKQKHGKMNTYKGEQEREVNDASNAAFRLLFKIIIGLVILASLIALIFI